MSSRERAVAIGMLGPAMSACGLLWMLAKSLILDPERATFRYFIFDAPHLLVAVGVVASLICIPVAISVALAEAADVEIPAFDEELVEDDEPMPGAQPEMPGRFRWFTK